MKDMSTNELNIAAILHVGGDVYAARECNERSERALVALAEVCRYELAKPREELRADRIVDAARDWAEKAHFAADAVRFAVRNADRISSEVGEAARRMVAVADEMKAKKAYADLTQLQATTAVAPDALDVWCADDIAWLEDCGGDACIYATEEEAAAARLKARRVAEQIAEEHARNWNW